MSKPSDEAMRAIERLKTWNINEDYTESRAKIIDEEFATKIRKLKKQVKEYKEHAAKLATFAERVCEHRGQERELHAILNEEDI